MASSSPARPLLRHRHVAEVVVRAAHAGVLLQRRPQLGPRALVLAEVPVGAADEDAGLRDRAVEGDLREEARGLVDPLRSQVPGGQGERELRVAGRQRSRVLQDAQRLFGMTAGGERLREEPAGLDVTGARACETSQDLHGRGGLSQLEVRQGEGLEREAVLERRGRGAPESLPGLERPALHPRERAHQQPALEESFAVVALGGLELALPQAGLRRRHRPLDGRGRIRGPGQRRTGPGPAERDQGAQGKPAHIGALERSGRFYPLQGAVSPAVRESPVRVKVMRPARRLQGTVGVDSKKSNIYKGLAGIPVHSSCIDIITPTHIRFPGSRCARSRSHRCGFTIPTQTQRTS